MHQPMQDGLEDYLSGKAAPERLRAFHAHLAECAECRGMVGAFEIHSRMMQALRPPEPGEAGGLQPGAGFYARVMERIENQQGFSIWSLFLEPVFGKRLALASLAVFVLLTSFALSTANPKPVIAGSDGVSVILEEGNRMYPPASGVDERADRDIVLTRLASYGDGGEQQPLLIPVRSE
jgi:hypothetical protein